MKVIIAGGRDFRNFDLLERNCDTILYTYFLDHKEDELEIVSGAQKTWDQEKKVWYGADYLGEVYAKQCGIKLTRFPADWNRLKKAAGPIRNKQMAEYALPDGILIAFWDKESTGTASMIREADKAGLQVYIINY